MSGAVPAPTAVYGKKNLRHLLDKRGLLFGSDHQVAVALLGRRQSGENPATDAEVRCAHMGAFFCTFKAESYATEVFYGHGESCGGALATVCHRFNRHAAVGGVETIVTRDAPSSTANSAMFARSTKSCAVRQNG